MQTARTEYKQSRARALNSTLAFNASARALSCSQYKQVAHYASKCARAEVNALIPHKRTRAQLKKQEGGERSSAVRHANNLNRTQTIARALNSTRAFNASARALKRSEQE